MMHVCFPWLRYLDGSAVDARRLSYAAEELDGLVGASLFAGLSISQACAKSSIACKLYLKMRQGKTACGKPPS